MTRKQRGKHTLPSTIRFFKIITAASPEDGKLRIPNSFTRKFGGDISNPLFLKPPDGKQWNIFWTKKDGDIWFQKGWKEFATHYFLDHGHMVLFEYEETSHFGVHIFDKSTLEIEYPFQGSQDEQNNINQINKESVEILDEQPSCKKTRPKSQISCHQPHKKLRTDTGQEVGRGSKLKNLPKHVQLYEDTCGKNECIKVEVEQEQEQLTPKVNEALDRPRNFISTNPSFTFVMKPSYLYESFLYVPSQFAKKYLEKEQSDILLQVLDGRTWPSKYHLGRISIGWKKFVSDNNLKVGDVCVFELTKGQTLTLKVLMFPLGEEPHSLPPQCNPKRKSVQGDEVNPLDPARISDVESKTIITNKGRNSLPNEAGEEANKFTSENPSFTVNIKQNECGDWRPSISTSFMRKYLDKKQNVLLKFWNNLWPVKLIYYPRKLTARLSRGWHHFMEVSKLQAGDVCVFELINREDAVFDVHIFRGHS